MIHKWGAEKQLLLIAFPRSYAQGSSSKRFAYLTYIDTRMYNTIQNEILGFQIRQPRSAQVVIHSLNKLLILTLLNLSMLVCTNRYS